MGNSFKIYRSLALNTQKLLGNIKLLRPIENKIIRSCSPELIPPVFIVGAPRTGSTILFQLLIRKYKFSYFNNLQSFFYASPAIIAKMSYRLTKKKALKFRLNSKYGYIKGVFSPSEAGAVFRYWFGEKGFSDRSTENRRKYIRNTINYISSLSSAPFLSKNLNNSLRLNSITSAFPEAFYIWIKRNPLYTSQSLIKMRRTLYGSENIWASVKPSTYKKLLKYEPFEQVARQIKDIEEFIGKTLNDRTGFNYIAVNYKNLCEDTQNVLNDVSKTYEGMCGFKLEDRANAELFTIEARDKKKMRNEEWKHLETIIKRLYKSNERI